MSKYQFIICKNVSVLKNYSVYRKEKVDQKVIGYITKILVNKKVLISKKVTIILIQYKSTF
jgi:hypothetical protein